jgi:hypothetical protein
MWFSLMRRWPSESVPESRQRKNSSNLNFTPPNLFASQGILYPIRYTGQDENSRLTTRKFEVGAEKFLCVEGGFYHVVIQDNQRRKLFERNGGQTGAA